MRKLISYIFIALLLSACGDNNTTSAQSETSKIDIKIKNHLTKDMGDPSTYSPVSTEQISDYATITLFKHTYRAKNNYNALVINTSYVFLFKNDSSIIALPCSIFEGYKDILAYGKNGETYVYETYAMLGTSPGFQLLYLERKDKSALLKTANFIHSLSSRSYEKLEDSMKQSPVGSIGSLILSMQRVAPEVTVDALIDSYK